MHPNGFHYAFLSNPFDLYYKRYYPRPLLSALPPYSTKSPMGSSGENIETPLLLPLHLPDNKIPKDSFNLIYITYFILGVSCLLPWNTFITAIDYFSHIYPHTHINRIFSVVYMPVVVSALLSVVFFGRRCDVRIRINLGLGLYVFSLLLMPLLEVFYIRGRVGLFNGFYVSIGAVVLCAVGQALVQSGVVGSAGELPKRYMQAAVSGFAGSGVLVSMLRLVTKALYPRDSEGLRRSAILYFSAVITFVVVSFVWYNSTTKHLIVKHYQNLKNQEKQKKGSLFGSITKSTFWEIYKTIRIYAFGVMCLFVITMSIFPGYVTEDVSSKILKDWYPITLITAYYVLDLIGKSLASFYVMKSSKITMGLCIGRVVFYPLFVGCLHGPKFLRTEIPVIILTCFLGLTNGYLTAVAMISAPKLVSFEHAEVAGILMAMSLVLGVAIGSVLAWFWVI
ncbi:hypothetical protein IC575_023520 [Cucumis melo]